MEGKKKGREEPSVSSHQSCQEYAHLSRTADSFSLEVSLSHLCEQCGRYSSCRFIHSFINEPEGPDTHPTQAEKVATILSPPPPNTRLVVPHNLTISRTKDIKKLKNYMEWRISPPPFPCTISSSSSWQWIREPPSEGGFFFLVPGSREFGRWGLRYAATPRHQRTLSLVCFFFSLVRYVRGKRRLLSVLSGWLVGWLILPPPSSFRDWDVGLGLVE